MKKFFASVLSLVLLCGLLSGCSQSGVKGGLTAPSNAGILSEDYYLVKTTRGDIQKTIKSTSPSTFRSLDAATAYFTVGGTISAVNITWGSKVKAGDVIATLAQEAEYKVSLAKAKQALDVAEINLNQAKTNAEGGGEIALAQLKWQQSKNELETSGGNNEQLRLKTEKLKATYENLAFKAKNTYSDLQCSYEILKGKYEIAQAKYDACFLKAPISGEVSWIGQRMSVGSTVKAYEQFATIESKNGLVHIYSGSASDAQYLTAGDIVTVITKADGLEYQGRILKTPKTMPTGVNYNMGVSTESNVYMIELFNYDYSKENVGGTGGDLVILLQSHKDVVLIETYLLKKETDANGQISYFVNILLNGIPIRKPITVGIVNGDLTEVTSGLDEGMEVIFIPS